MGILFTSIFFFFSGYGLITSYLNKENYLDSFLIRRIPAVLFPFLITNIIYAYYETVGWSGTTLRWMLNEEFLYEVFTKDEQSYLVADENLGDTIFLLDENQILTYFSDAESRMYAPTRLSKKAGGFSVNASSGCASWWIRTDEPEIKCSVVDYYGEMDDDGIYVNVPSIAVRPAMWVKIN